jgi:hypothetical protein
MNYHSRNHAEEKRYRVVLSSDELDTLQNVVEALRAEWTMNLSQAMLVDGLSDIATAEAVLRKIDPLVASITQARRDAEGERQ